MSAVNRTFYYDRVLEETAILKIEMRSYNSQTMKEMSASFDTEAEYADLRSTLSTLNSQQTSICKVRAREFV